MAVIFVLNGPNLNMLGIREPEIYGTQTLDEIRRECERKGAALGLTVDFRQSNHEGVLIDWIHEAHKVADGIVLNAAGHTRTSLAILDALKAVGKPVVELHLSNVFKREAYRPPSYISHGADGVICGFGGFGYVLALEAIARLVSRPGGR